MTRIRSAIFVVTITTLSVLGSMQSAIAAPVDFPIQVVNSRGIPVVGENVYANQGALSTPYTDPGVIMSTDATGRTTWRGEQGTTVTAYTREKACTHIGMTSTPDTLTFTNVQPGSERQVVVPVLAAAWDPTSYQRTMVSRQMTTSEARMLAYVNEERARLGRAQLTPVDRLNWAADKHAWWLGSYGKLDHCGDRGSSVEARAWDVGVIAGENSEIGSGNANPDETWAAIAGNSAHYNILMDSRYTHVGVGMQQNRTIIQVAGSCLSGCSGSVTPPYVETPNGDDSRDPQGADTTPDAGGDDSSGPVYRPSIIRVRSFAGVAFVSRRICRPTCRIVKMPMIRIRTTGRVTYLGTVRSNALVTVRRRTESGRAALLGRTRTNKYGWFTKISYAPIPRSKMKAPLNWYLDAWPSTQLTTVVEGQARRVVVKTFVDRILLKKRLLRRTHR